MKYDYLPIGTRISVTDIESMIGVCIGNEAEIIRHRPDYEDKETYTVELKSGNIRLFQVISRDQFDIL